jgi:hypothetical protein
LNGRSFEGRNALEDFVRRENMIVFTPRLACAKNDAQRQRLLKLLAEESERPSKTASAPGI